MIMPESEIIIIQGNDIDHSTLNEEYIVVKGNKSGIHKGNLKFSSVNKLFYLNLIHNLL